MESLILNAVTVGLTSCIIPATVRLLLKRPLGKGAAVAVVVANTLFMVIAGVVLRGLILTGGLDSQPAGGNYITYGVGVAAFASWALLTTAAQEKPSQVRKGEA
jgi:hypothetical protein